MPASPSGGGEEPRPGRRRRESQSPREVYIQQTGAGKNSQREAGDSVSTHAPSATAPLPSFPSLNRDVNEGTTSKRLTLPLAPNPLSNPENSSSCCFSSSPPSSFPFSSSASLEESSPLFESLVCSAESPHGRETASVHSFSEVRASGFAVALPLVGLVSGSSRQERRPQEIPLKPLSSQREEERESLSTDGRQPSFERILLKDSETHHFSEASSRFLGDSEASAASFLPLFSPAPRRGALPRPRRLHAAAPASLLRLGRRVAGCTYTWCLVPALLVFAVLLRVAVLLAVHVAALLRRLLLTAKRTVCTPGKRQLFEVLEVWVLAALVGLFTGFSAFYIHHASTFVSDLRVGFCRSFFWLDREQCCGSAFTVDFANNACIPPAPPSLQFSPLPSSSPLSSPASSPDASSSTESADAVGRGGKSAEGGEAAKAARLLFPPTWLSWSALVLGPTSEPFVHADLKMRPSLSPPSSSSPSSSPSSSTSPSPSSPPSSSPPSSSPPSSSTSPSPSSPPSSSPPSPSPPPSSPPSS
ncbi:chloride transporter, chloride channel (ClC) family protein, partial [Toxoplasma gondii TgCatPRC2]